MKKWDFLFFMSAQLDDSFSVFVCVLTGAGGEDANSC